MSMGLAEQWVGPFRLEGLLGRGATGAVYRATHGSSGVAVALKLLNRQVGHRAGLLLLREVEAAARGRCCTAT